MEHNLGIMGFHHRSSLLSGASTTTLSAEWETVVGKTGVRERCAISALTLNLTIHWVK